MKFFRKERRRFRFLQALVLSLWTLGASGHAFSPAHAATINGEVLSAEEVIERSLKDSLYYNYQKWFDLFAQEIHSLERESETIDNQINLMMYYFFSAGLLGEYSHTLAFTSKFKIKKIENDFIRYSERAKSMAKKVLAMPGLTNDQKARANLYLGASEGYIGIYAYGAGHFFQALINGLRADNHLEEALSLDPSLIDAHLGLGIYRYGNSRLGGMGNLIMQFGRDLRQVGLDHLEQAIRGNAPSSPLALKTLIWFNISEQINPDNSDLPPEDPLYKIKRRARVLELIETFEKRYLENPPYPDFKGNKEMAMMKAIQYVLDADYGAARHEFQNVLDITGFLKNSKGFEINPQLTRSVEAGIKFCDLMMLDPPKDDARKIQSACRRLDDQLTFLNSGGTMIDYDAKKIRRELHAVFSGALNDRSRQWDC